MQTPTEQTPAERIDATAAALGLALSAEFVPFSASRNKDNAHKSLNWRVTLQRGGRDILTTDYSQGEAYCPSYKRSVRELGHAKSMLRAEAIDFETQHGRHAPRGSLHIPGKPLSPPALRDVLYSLSMDSSVLNYPSFESWASEFGYDTDSRSAEATWKACLEIALPLRAAIGDAGLEQLRAACEDY